VSGLRYFDIVNWYWNMRKKIIIIKALKLRNKCGSILEEVRAEVTKYLL
jgi:hypothetical protein